MNVVDYVVCSTDRKAGMQRFANIRAVWVFHTTPIISEADVLI